MSYHTGCSYKIRKFQPGQSSVVRRGGGREDEARATIASRDGRNRRQKG